MVRKRQGLILGVYSAKGGVGKTTTVANLGAGLGQELEDKVIIVETNMTASNLGLHLGVLEPTVVIQDVAMGRVDVEESISTTEYGFHFIPGSVAFQGDLGEIDFSSILAKLRESYEIIIVDSAPGFGLEVTAGMKACDELLVISQPRVPAIAGTLQTLRRADALNIPTFGVLLNHITGKDFEIPTSEIKRTLGWPNLFEIPDDDAVPMAIHDGEPVVLHSPNSPAAKGFRKLSSGLLEHLEERKNSNSSGNREEQLTELMKEYEEETGKYAIWGGEVTEGYKKWRRERNE